MVRHGLSTGNAGEFGVLGILPATTAAQSSYTPVRLTTTSITNATVDNANYAYLLQCELANPGVGIVGIYGADVTYTISAANG